MSKIVLDTNVILNFPETLKMDNLLIPLKVIDELDKLKTSDKAVSYKARIALKVFEENLENIEVDVLKRGVLDSLEDSPDNQILTCAYDNNCKLYTNDLNMLVKAKSLNIECDMYKVRDDSYKGYSEVEPTDEQWMLFINKGKIEENIFNLLIGEYCLLTKEGVPQSVHKWDGKELVEVKSKTFPSNTLDNFKPKDLYQIACVDSLLENDLTFLTGSAGTGKTLISLSYLMWALERNKIKKIYIVHNPVYTKDSQAIGYLKGDMIEKMLGSSLGGILVSKFGGLQPIENMINFGQLEIVPMSSIRGMEVKKDEALYITEAQNLSRYLAKTAIQRCATGSKILLEGDTAQVDSYAFAGLNNGFKCAIEAFKGQKDVGVVELKNIYRNKFTEIAENI